MHSHYLESKVMGHIVGKEKESANNSKVFISHANPEDNYFASWLATKLALAGYDVWCDVRALSGGEDFWIEIEEEIRDNSIKFIFIISEHSVEKRGTKKELAIADNVADRPEFILPLRLDKTEFSQLPSELIRLNAIDFSNAWADGLKVLLRNLSEKSVPRRSIANVPTVYDYWQAKFDSDLSVKKKTEEYRTNWFSFELPSKLFVYSKARSQGPLPVPTHGTPIIRIRDYFLTFLCKEKLPDQFASLVEETVSTETFLKERVFHSPSSGIEIRDTNRKVIQLLNASFEEYLFAQGMRPYNLSNSRAFYFSKLETGDFPKADLSSYKRRWIQLAGKYVGREWHYAISASAFLYPVPAFSISSHVVFKQNGELISESRQHTSRRGIGKRWFNQKWRDLLLGTFVLLENDEDKKVTIDFGCQNYLTIDRVPITLESKVGYSEPEKKSG